MPTPTPSVPPGLVTILRGEPVRWRDLGLTRNEFFEVCDREELRGLVFAHLASSNGAEDWPDAIREELAQSAREETAREMLRREEIAGVLSALDARGVRPILLKGAGLAYTAYPDPIARPRLDTDVLIDAADEALAREVLTARGYTAPPYCAELFAQFEMDRHDEFGLRHIMDVHWKISTQPAFADVLTYQEMLPRTMPVPALGPAAIAPSAADALLLACIHPVMHHQNAERVLWVYDTHVLASRLTPHEFDDFVRRARQSNVAAVCGHALRLAQTLFETPVPAGVVRELSAVADEPSADYLASQRRWHDELASSVRGLPRFADRVKLMRAVLLPSPSYMLGAYGLRGKPLAPLLLPALYLHRNARGAWKILMGKK